MSNPDTKNDKKNGKKKQKTKIEKSDPAPLPGGRLIALDGAHGPSLIEDAPRLARMCGRKSPAWSLFDASNTFHELGMAKAKTLTPTPRTLILLYASDLLFRLRWEIEPTLLDGRDVVAAPYVQTATAFGIAAGLPKEWLDQLFSFAPKPVVTFRLKEKKKGKGKKEAKKNGDSGAPGFVEFSCANLARNSPGWDSAEIRAGMIGYLKGLEDQDQILKFGKKLPKHLLKG